MSTESTAHLFTALCASNMDRHYLLCDVDRGPVAPNRNPSHHQVPQFRSISSHCHLHDWQSVKSISGSHLSWGNRALLIGPASWILSVTGGGVGRLWGRGVDDGNKEEQITKTSCHTTTTTGCLWHDVRQFRFRLHLSWKFVDAGSEKSTRIATLSRKCWSLELCSWLLMSSQQGLDMLLGQTQYEVDD